MRRADVDEVLVLEGTTKAVAEATMERTARVENFIV